MSTSASAQLADEELIGRNGTKWKIVSKISTRPGHTPGQFSYTYKVANENGDEAFLKASDLGMFSGAGDDFLNRMIAAGTAHQFERSILDHCHGNNMDRVVIAIDYGNFETTKFGFRDTVFFIVFELASGDLRSHVDVKSQPELVWITQAIRNFLVGIRQLHAGNVCHNDFKPANALVFKDDLHKVADLGRATSPIAAAPHDGLLCAGDLRFAAPEQLYNRNGVLGGVAIFDRGRAGDLYSVGSVIHYILTKRMVTPEIIQALSPDHRPATAVGGWQDDFTAILPHWRLSFDDLVADLIRQTRVPNGAEQEIWDAMTRVVIELCEPDPSKRGHPSNKAATQDTYDLQRYVTHFDVLTRKAALLRK